MRLPILISQGLPMDPALLAARNRLAKQLQAAVGRDRRLVVICRPEMIGQYPNHRIWTWDGKTLRPVGSGGGDAA